MSVSNNPFHNFDVKNLNQTKAQAELNQKFEDIKKQYGYGKVRNLKPEQKLDILKKVFKEIKSEDPNSNIDRKRIRRIAKYVYNQASGQKKSVLRRAFEALPMLFGRASPEKKFREEYKGVQVSFLGKIVSSDDYKSDKEGKIDSKINTWKNGIKTASIEGENAHINIDYLYKFLDRLDQEFYDLEKSLDPAKLKGTPEEKREILREAKLKADYLRKRSLKLSEKLSRHKLLKASMHFAGKDPADAANQRYAEFYENIINPC